MANDEARAAAAAMNTCRAICLWESDADLMIRKAQGWERARKSEYAAEARKGEALEAAGESGVSEQIREFEDFFALELRAVRDTMETVMALEASDAETAKLKLFDWWHEQLTELHNVVSGAASFLPTQLRQRFGKSLADSETRLREERERLTPKKKFGFKNRSKVGGTKAGAKAPAAPAPAAEEAGGGAVPTGGGVAHVPKADTFQAPAGCQGFRRQSKATLIRPAGESISGEFAVEELEDCEVRLLSQSSVLWIRGLKRCTLFALPVKGSIYVTECEDCTLYLGSRQLRMHTSSRVDFYVHASSHPIIEHCTALRFAPYPTLPLPLAPAYAAAALQPEHNQWALVDDFDWLKATHSPNWAELPEAERKPPAFLDEGKVA